MKENIFHIRRSDSIQRMQDHFSSLFPSLRISFFRDPDKLHETDSCVMFSPPMKLGEINPMLKDLEVEIKPDMRIADLERKMHELGLHAQISCRTQNKYVTVSTESTWFLSDVYGVDTPPAFTDNHYPHHSNHFNSK